jgi:glutamate synthase (NADPH/NADH) small chain
MLTAPVEFVSDGKGWLNAARCVRMEVGEPDASGRRRPVPKEGSGFDLSLSVAIVAIGTSANPIVQSTTLGLGTNKAWIYSSQRRDAAHDVEGRVCRRRCRDRRSHSDSRHGCETPRGQIDS